MKSQYFRSGVALLLAACMMAGTWIHAGAFTVQAEETSLRGQKTGTVTIEETENSYTIGNEYLSRTFSTEDGKFKTVNVKNYRTDGSEPTVFAPSEGSTEFVIATLDGESKSSEYVLERTGWEVTANCQRESSSNEGPITHVLDGNVATIWHTPYDVQGNSTAQVPYYIVLNMKNPTTFQSIGCTPRTTGENGCFKKVEVYLYAGDETLAYSSEQWGEAVTEASFAKGNSVQYIDFETPQTAKMILLKITETYPSSTFGSLAELNLYSRQMNSLDLDKGFTSDDLTVHAVTSKDVEATVNKVDKTGVEMTVEFNPYTYNSVEYTIKEIVTMYDGDSFMRKHLEISVPEEQAASAKIDHIDLENMQIADQYLEEDTYWTIPEQEDNSSMADMKGDYLELGQPYYMAAMYWGCEFPETENKIRDGKAFIRYHYGKSLEKDSHFEYNKNKTAGKMTTWDVVVGAARSTDYSVVQADFYEYIETIATDTDFRQQYNSWYDNMKNITKENLEKSFFEIEKGFTQHGANPLDSYVADDGWINYSSFWDFDTSKFPNELYDASLQAEQMGSNFGLWLGPRGGYGTQDQISNWIARNNMGSVNPQSESDINISDARYVNHLEDLLIDYQKKFGINYWKFDGMLLEPCTVASEYYTTTSALDTITETYERWTDLYENIRDSYEANHDLDAPILWLNMTSYTNPSPWHVQWVNSVWMQNTGDTGYLDKFNATDEQSMLTYRDNCYYNFLKERQWQLPNKYFYNHDPVYGLEANNSPYYNHNDQKQISYSTEELRDHLYMLGTRGTAFWEYYYSYSMFDDEKWDVNAEAAAWIEENFDILQKSQMIGGKPEDGDIYGYSCWNGSEGIVSLRNPNNEEQTYTLTYDRLIGVEEGMSKVYGKVIVGNISYQEQFEDAVSYGDEITFTLPAKEVLIVQYGEKDEAPAVIESVHAVDTATVEVKFNEAIRTPEIANFTVEGNTVTAVSLNADLRTAVLTLENDLEETKSFTLKAAGVKDTAGNVTAASVAGDYYKDQLVTAIDKVTLDGTEILKLSAVESIDGSEGFTVAGKLNTTSKNAVILKQENAYQVSIDENGYLEFSLCNGLKVNSKYTVKTVDRTTDGHPVSSADEGIIADGADHRFAAVKEVNGMIKLYIDGTLVASAYEEDQMNPELKKSAILIGEGFSGTLSYVEVLDTALPYDEVDSYSQRTAAQQKISISADKVTASGYDQSENVPPDRAVDGNPDTYWATAAATKDAVKNQWIRLELDEVSRICRVDYTMRYHSSALWNCTGNLEDYIIEVSTDGENWTPVASGTTNEGTTEITFDEVEAKYVRLKATKSYHHDSNLLNSVMTAAEIAVYKKAEIDKTLLEAVVGEGRELLKDEDLYTEESVEDLKKAVAAAELILKNPDATVTEAALAVESVRAAMDSLVLRKTENENETPGTENRRDEIVDDKDSEYVQGSEAKDNITEKDSKPSETYPLPSQNTATGAKTGDSTSLLLWGAILGTGILGSAMFGKKRKEDNVK